MGNEATAPFGDDKQVGSPRDVGERRRPKIRKGNESKVKRRGSFRLSDHQVHEGLMISNLVLNPRN